MFLLLAPKSFNKKKAFPNSTFCLRPAMNAHVKLAAAMNSYKTNSNAVRMLAERQLVIIIKIYDHVLFYIISK